MLSSLGCLFVYAKMTLVLAPGLLCFVAFFLFLFFPPQAKTIWSVSAYLLQITSLLLNSRYVLFLGDVGKLQKLFLLF